MEFRVCVHPKLSEQCILTLDESKATYYPCDNIEARTTISLGDVIGADLKQTAHSGIPSRAGGSAAGSGDGEDSARPAGSDPSSSGAAGKRADAAATRVPPAVTVYYYPPSKGVRGRSRKRQVITFVFTRDSDVGDAEKFYAFVKAALKRGACSLSRGSRDSERFSRTLLVLINPRSGSGRAGHDFQHLVKPMLDEAAIAYEVRVTNHAGHATEIMKELNLDDWYGVVIVSGDGLTYEVYQGLMARPDWETAVRFPVGILPGGSGNALSCAVNSAAGEPILESRGLGRRGPAMLHATHVLLKHNIVPMDLVAVDTLDGRVYSFLSVTWGIIADVDIESESYRSLGNMRFTIGAIARILRLRKYRGKVYYLPIERYRKLGHAAAAVPAEALAAPAADSQATADAQAAAEPPGAAAGPPDAEASPPASEGEPAPFVMPSLNDPVPADWKMVDTEFITVAACYQTHLGPDAIVSTVMTFDAGYIDLLMCPAKGVTRSDVMDVFKRMEKPHPPPADPRQEWPIERVRVAAFRIEPEPLPGVIDGGNLMVDGERMRFGRIQGHVMPAAAQLMAKRL